MWRAAAAFAMAVVGRTDQARRAFEALTSPTGLAEIPRDGEWLSTIALLIRTGAWIGDGERTWALGRAARAVRRALGRRRPRRDLLRAGVAVHRVRGGRRRPLRRRDPVPGGCARDRRASGAPIRWSRRIRVELADVLERAGADAERARLSCAARAWAARGAWSCTGCSSAGRPKPRRRPLTAAAPRVPAAAPAVAAPRGRARRVLPARRHLDDRHARRADPAAPRQGPDATSPGCSPRRAWSSTRWTSSRARATVARAWPSRSARGWRSAGAATATPGPRSTSRRRPPTALASPSCRRRSTRRTSFNDPERAARARDELGFLARELAGAVGLGGRDRKTGSDAERARVNVTRAIRTALKRVSDHDPVLGPQPRQRDPHGHVLRLRAAAGRRADLGPHRPDLTGPAFNRGRPGTGGRPLRR